MFRWDKAVSGSGAIDSDRKEQEEIVTFHFPDPSWEKDFYERRLYLEVSGKMKKVGPFK